MSDVWHRVSIKRVPVSRVRLAICYESGGVGVRHEFRVCRDLLLRFRSVTPNPTPHMDARDAACRLNRPAARAGGRER